MICSKCGRQIADGSTFCPNCGIILRQAFKANPLDDPRGMKWFKFIIYFQLFASAVLNVINGIVTLTGAHYGGNAASVYSYYSGLRIIDILFGIFFLALAGLSIYTRQRLAKFFRNGPTLYYAILIANIAAAFLYPLVMGAVTGIAVGEVLTPNVISSNIANLALLIVNVIYFNKRADLFVN